MGLEEQTATFSAREACFACIRRYIRAFCTSMMRGKATPVILLLRALSLPCCRCQRGSRHDLLRQGLLARERLRHALRYEAAAILLPQRRLAVSTLGTRNILRDRSRRPPLPDVHRCRDNNEASDGVERCDHEHGQRPAQQNVDHNGERRRYDPAPARGGRGRRKSAGRVVQSRRETQHGTWERN